ncbi:MAG TPA: glycosyltransferase family A protein [Capillimicrobium sp.]|nr:glycosyltransferase family A protein [Capillimicrobium sp.]
MAADFAVVVCTRNRAAHLARTLDALEAQEDRDFEVLVVDQSDAVDLDLAAREVAGRCRVLRGTGRGLSRARNAAWPLVEARWVVFVDDDCLTPPDWSRRLRAALAEHRDAAFVTGHVGEHRRGDTDDLVVSAFPVARTVVRRGRRTWPWAVGFGVCMAVRRDWIERLGGWDERLGAGVPALPAGEDMDFNHRLLRAGGTAVAVADVRCLHDQWRTRAELPGVFEGYATGWAGFSVKQLRTGHPLEFARLWGFGAYGALKMIASAGRRRSRLRLRVGLALCRGHLVGTGRALRVRW